MSVPLFLTITTTGKISVSNKITDTPPGGGTVLQTFRILDDTTNQVVCTLTGSGNSSASALAVTGATKTGSAEGNEIH